MTTTVALAQIAPVWLDRQATLAKVVDRVREAAAAGARLVAFGEALVPGYPFWVEHTDGARFESPLQKALYAHYARAGRADRARRPEPVLRGGARSAALGGARHHRAARRSRRPQRLRQRWCYIDDAGEIRNVHRKLMPTYEERLVWSPGDGHGLRVLRIDGVHARRAELLGKLDAAGARGAVRAGRRPARGDLAGQRAQHRRHHAVHRARRALLRAVRVGGLMRREDIPRHMPHVDLLRATPADGMADGGSCIAAPDGDVGGAAASARKLLIVAEHRPPPRARGAAELRPRRPLLASGRPGTPGESPANQRCGVLR